MVFSLRSVHDSHWLKCLVLTLWIAALGTPGFARDSKSPVYAFTAGPLEICDRLPELKLGTVPAIPAEERRLLETAWKQTRDRTATGGKTDESLVLEALLFASGIEDARARKLYRERFDALLDQARQALAGAKNDRERGERLMAFLHKGVMSKGYAGGQSSFAAVFDTGKYNCVSSTAMYYVLGTRFGLDLRPISIPGDFLAGHATLDLVDKNQRIQVEPTNPDGFDWEVKSKRPGVIVWGLIPDRKKGTEIAALGIPAMIYSNRGVELGKATPPNRLGAARCYLAALALNPTDETASQNLLSLFVNWGPKLAEQKQYEEAIRVLAFGLSLAPKAQSLHTNHSNAWARYIENTLESGRDQDALLLIRRAGKAIPGDRDYQSESHWFCRHGQKHIDKKGWEAGLEVVNRGNKVLSEAETKKLLAWRSSVFRRWSQSLLAKQDVAGSLQVLARAYRLDSKDAEIIAGIVYHTQEALAIVERKDGLPAMMEHYQALCAAFPGVTPIAEVGFSHAQRGINRLAEAGKFEEAVKAMDQYQPLLAKPEQRSELAGIAYDRWAQHLAKGKEWKAALDKYAEGLKAFPKQARLTNNALVTIDQWARPAMNVKRWDEAIRIYQVGLEYFPGDRYLQEKVGYCEKKKKG